MHRFCSSSCVILTLFYLESIFSELVLLTLGLTSAKSRSHVQLIRAELSSNASSEPPSDRASELNSHQKARPNFFRSRLQAELSSNPSLSLEGTTTAKGLYANFFFVLYHYAFGGVSAQCSLFALCTPLRPRGRIGVFRRREGPPRKPLSGTPSSASSCTVFFIYEAYPHAEVRRLRIHAPVDPLSLLLVLRLRSCELVYAREVPVQGADGCAFPSAIAGVF